MESYIKPFMRKELEKHVLIELAPSNGGLRWFRLQKPPAGRMMSTMLLFTPEGIIICGDLCPRPGDNRGVISDFGYDLVWFSGELDEQYLCEKFLRKEWQAEAAAEWCDEYIKALREDADSEGGEAGPEKQTTERLAELADALRTDGMNVFEFADAVRSIDPDLLDGSPGIDYPRAAAGWLCAIQQRFAELYLGKNEAAVAQTQ